LNRSTDDSGGGNSTDGDDSGVGEDEREVPVPVPVQRLLLLCREDEGTATNAEEQQKVHVHITAKRSVARTFIGNTYILILILMRPLTFICLYRISSRETDELLMIELYGRLECCIHSMNVNANANASARKASS
jgi:hypothetical protein